MVRAEAKRTANKNKQELESAQKKNQGLCSDLKQLETMFKEFDAAQKSHRSSKIPVSAPKKDSEPSDERLPNETPVPSMAQQGTPASNKVRKIQSRRNLSAATRLSHCQQRLENHQDPSGSRIARTSID
jgi:hypothetical protein